MKNYIDGVISKLLSKEPFYLAVSNEVDKVEDNSSPFVAGVGITDAGNIQLVYNKDMFEKLTDEEKCAILKHEYRHIILGHLDRGKYNSLASDRKKLIGEGKTETDEFYRVAMELTKWNYAKDLAVNSFDPQELPDSTLKPGEGMFINMPPFLSAEEYYTLLPDIKDKDGTGHGGHYNGNSGLAKQKIRKILKNAASVARKRGFGSVCKELKDKIDFSTGNKLDYKGFLKQFVSKNVRIGRRSTMRKLNKRMPYQLAGRVSNRTAKIGIAIDVSGSMSDDDLSFVFGALRGMSNHVSFTVCQFDEEVFEDSVLKWDKGKTPKILRHGCGGTSFDPPTEWAEKNRFDGLIIMTDMCAEKPRKCGCQRMWIKVGKYNSFDISELVVYLK